MQISINVGEMVKVARNAQYGGSAIALATDDTASNKVKRVANARGRNYD